jgi:hypothetical protein
MNSHANESAEIILIEDSINSLPRKPLRHHTEGDFMQFRYKANFNF